MYEINNEADGSEDNKIYLDELRPYAVREPSKIKPGDRVVFVHLPQLIDSWGEYNPQQAYGTLGTIVELVEKSPAELEPLAPRYPGDDKRSLMVFFTSENQLTDEPRRRYASDSGIVPYSSDLNHYNTSNFTVLVDEIESQGLEIALEVKPFYAKQLEEFNEEIESRGYSLTDEFDDGYDE